MHKWLQGLLTYPAPAKKEDDEEEKPGDKFAGALSHGQRDGKGKYVWSNGCYYDGQYKDHMRHGPGILTFPDKSRYEGMHECSIFCSLLMSMLLQIVTSAQLHQTPCVNHGCISLPGSHHTDAAVQETGLKTKCMVKDFTPTPMETCTPVPLSMVLSMDRDRTISRSTLYATCALGCTSNISGETNPVVLAYNSLCQAS